MRQAVVIVLEHGGKVLMVRRAAGRPGGGYWSPPSGRIEPGESPEQAAAREMLEETRLAVRVGELVFRCPAEGAPFDLLWYRAGLEGDPASMRLCADEIDEARWCDRGEVLVLSPIFAVTRSFFEGWRR